MYKPPIDYGPEGPAFTGPPVPSDPALDPQVRNYVSPRSIDPKSPDLNAHPLPGDIARPKKANR